MPRQSKPYFRQQTQSWYCSINGKQFPLGKNKTQAFEKFYELMGKGDELKSFKSTLYDLTQAYLDWCQANRKPGTYDNHKKYLSSLIDSVGKKLRVGDLKKHHLTKWMEGKDWGSTSQHDAVSVVKRAYNWAMEEGYIAFNPIAQVRKAPKKRRDIFYSADQWAKIREQAKGPLIDLLDFLWSTGCRPQEARILEASHVHGDVVIFALDESKGEKHQRVLFLTSEPLAIIKRLSTDYPSGPLFRNRHGRPWTKDAIKCALTRISEKVGFRVIAYGARHGYATNALLNGVDPISVSHLMGHRSPAMVSKVYSHLAQNHDFLRQQAVKASATSEPVATPKS